MKELTDILISEGTILLRNNNGHVKANANNIKSDNFKKKYSNHIRISRGLRRHSKIFPGTETFYGDESKYKVEISNLVISGAIDEMVCLDSLTDKPLKNNTSAFGKSVITDLIFSNCVFIVDRSPDDKAGERFSILKNQQSLLEFSQCIFVGICLIIRQLTSFDDRTDGEYSIVLKDMIDISQGSSHHEIFPHFNVFKHKAHSSQIDHFDSDLTKMLIENSGISELAIGYVAKLEFTGGNVIDRFKLNMPKKKFAPADDGHINKISLDDYIFSHRSLNSDLSPKKEIFEIMINAERNIHWSSSQNIKPWNSVRGLRTRTDWHNHKDFLIELLEIAKKAGNQNQENVLKREIMICDHQMICTEPWLSTIEDRIVLGFSKWVSNYGVSWVRPLVCLCAGNFFYALLVAIVVNETSALLAKLCTWDTWIVAANAFNPISGPIIPDKEISLSGAFLTILFSLQKGFLAIIIYELIRAGRRYTRYSGD